MEDTIKLPLDADGVPIRPGDVVYLFSQTAPSRVAAMQYDNWPGHPWDVILEGDNDTHWLPEHLSHTKPDTLEDIEKAINELIEEATLDYLAKVEIKEKAAPLMERIKRMVER